MIRIRQLPLRAKLLYGLLALLVVAYAGSLFLNQQLAQALEPEAEKRIDELDTPSNELLYEVRAGKTYVFFGPAKGTVEVFVKTVDENGLEAYHSVDYYYEEQNGAWQYLGSGASASEERKERSRAAFAAEG